MGSLRKLIPAALVIAALPALAAKKKMGEDLSGMIIQGENRLRVEPKSPLVDWTPAATRDVQGQFQDYSLLGDLTPPAIQDPPVVLPEKSVSRKTSSPWLERIAQPPVLHINFTPPDAVAKNNAGWAFIIKDSSGNTFYEFKGAKDMPKEVTWEGFSGRGEPLHVGYDYSFSFSAIDEAGNPHRHAGKPFRIDAFRYKKGSALITAFQPEVIFADKSSLKPSADGLDYLTEVKDALRRRYGSSKVEVICYEEDAKFALSRAHVLRDWLVKALDLPDDWITEQGSPVSKGGGYRHVDIVVK
jgi:hypothetical protein